MLTSLPFLSQTFLRGKAEPITASPDGPAWEEEKQEILERMNWLSEKVLVDPERLLKSMPSMIGPMYGGQWAIYCCSMFAAALANISRIYPEEKPAAMQKMEQLIDIVLSPAIKRFDADDWREDPIQGLKGKKGHFTYLTTLAWMLGMYKKESGSDKYDKLFHDVCEGINHRMLAHKDMNVVSFQNHIVFISDMVLACVALQMHGKFFNGEFADTADRWMQLAKKELIHRPTGILVAEKKYGWKPRVRGSYAALTNFYLTQYEGEDEFVRDQHMRLEKVFRKDKPYAGIKEYQRQGDGITFDLNAGPMAYGLSTSGTALTIGEVTWFGEWEYRYKMLQTANELAQTVRRNGQCHYRLAEVAPVGEAFMLAMRTNRKE